MKNYWILILLFLFPIIINAQSTELKSGNNLNIGITQVKLDPVKTVKIHNDSINHQILLVNSHLNSIQIKWDWVLNNPEEKAIAENGNWFEDMTEIRTRLETRKQKLINSLK